MIITCKRCGRYTNSMVSDYWDNDEKKCYGSATKCYAAHVKGGWVKGCGFDEADELTKEMVENFLKKEK